MRRFRSEHSRKNRAVRRTARFFIYSHVFGSSRLAHPAEEDIKDAAIVLLFFCKLVQAFPLLLHLLELLLEGGLYLLRAILAVIHKLLHFLDVFPDALLFLFELLRRLIVATNKEAGESTAGVNAFFKLCGLAKPVVYLPGKC